MRAERVIKRKIKIAEDKLVRSPAGRKLWNHGYQQGRSMMRNKIVESAFHLKYTFEVP